MKSPLIFVIDKNPIHSSLIKYHLNINRFLNVQVLQSGDECSYQLKKSIFPDFIITDYFAGAMNGFELISEIKAKSPETRIIFFSSHDDSILAFRLLDAGASDYILKTSKLAAGITELIKNVKYLCREEIQVKRIL